MSKEYKIILNLHYLTIFIVNKIVLMEIAWKTLATLNPYNCCPNEDIAPRIVGGSSKDIEAYPFVLALAHATDDKKQHIVCGASIVSKRWAISAYHCLNYFWNLNLFTEDMYLLGNSTLWEKGTVHRVAKYITNKKTIQAQDFDVFLLKVVKPFSGLHEKPILIARHDYIYRSKKTVTVVGWGLTNAENLFPEEKLRGVSLVLYANQQCKKIFHYVESDEKFDITDQMVCAGPAKISEKSDACQIDSGGPLIDGDILIGIVSWGTGCGKGFPGIYVRLSKFESWIRSVELSQKESIAKFKKTPFK